VFRNQLFIGQNDDLFKLCPSLINDAKTAFDINGIAGKLAFRIDFFVQNSFAAIDFIDILFLYKITVLLFIFRF
jgi:hypothetical protein